MDLDVRQGVRGRVILLALAAGLAYAALALLPSGVRAASEVDAGCPGPPDAAPIPILGDRREAQTFTAMRTGALQRAVVAINNFSTGDPDFLVQILPTDSNGVPADGPLASAGVPTASVPGGGVNLDVTFSPGAIVFAGHQYALAVSRPGANFVIPTWQLQTRNPAACPGASFFSSGPDAAWAPEPMGVDLIFQTYVDPAAVSLGRNANFSLVQRRGRLFAKVPGPGKVVVDDAQRPKKRKIARRGGFIKHTKARAKKAGLVKLDVLLTKFAIKRAFARRKLNVLGRVTYMPTGGTPSSIIFRIKFHL